MGLPDAEANERTIGHAYVIHQVQPLEEILLILSVLFSWQ
jgi:hypothetical protein